MRLILTIHDPKIIQYNHPMKNPHYLDGVYAAVITPLTSQGKIDLEQIPSYLGFLAQRGCHGALLLGTTGEGPSFAHHERVELMKAALDVRQEHPDFKLLAGTGTPSLEETELVAWISWRTAVPMRFNSP